MNIKQAIFSMIALTIIVILLIQNPGINTPAFNTADAKLTQFSSEEEFSLFIEEIKKDSSNDYYGVWGGRGGTVEMLAMESSDTEGSANTAPQKTSADDYSTTNIQIKGVDEPDFIKNDGKYIYAISGNKLNIIEAFPAEDMKILSTVEFKGSVQNIFLKDDKIIIFENGLYYGHYSGSEIALDDDVENVISKRIVQEEEKFTNYIKIYDISDRESPELENEIGYDGNYIDARMIENHVYLVSSKYLNYDKIELPLYSVDGAEQKIATTDVYYPSLRDSGYQFTTIAAIGLEDESFETETYLLGASRTLFMSQNNIYLTQQKRADQEELRQLQLEIIYKPLLPSDVIEKIEEIFANKDLEEYEKDSKASKLFSDQIKNLAIEDTKDLEKRMEEFFEEYSIRASKLQKTAVYKISVDESDIEYEATGLIPGTILNQFSMDEHKGNLRIATTTGNSWWGFGGGRSESLNHLYILDEELEIIGSVEDLAKGERIYSARFMGDKAYMVTYRNVDPLFVIDVKDPKNPEVLGYLKVSGYSSYLHPYDENHLIGIGMETEIVGEDRALNQGVKISLFDVSDFDNPIEVDKIEIGDRGSRTDAMYDHKAVLFDKKKNLLVIPITVYEDSNENNKEGWWNQDFVHTGAYVFNIDTSGITKRGAIIHTDKSDLEGKEDEYFYMYQDQVKRSLFMDDVLYTVSEYFIKANDLENLDLIKEIQVRDKDDRIIYY
jgi:inhibitor of cysteine peptidase